MKELIAFFAVLILIAALFFGYVANIWKFAHLDFKAPYKAEILRGVGIFPVSPMGVVEGYMNIND
jgi:hypothetical protein